jgi:hypothetical protein
MRTLLSFDLFLNIQAAGQMFVVGNRLRSSGSELAKLKAKGYVGRRASKYTLGIQNHCQNSNKRNSFQTDLWHRGRHSSRDRANHPKDDFPQIREK